jgi:hypothetical protein
MAYLNAQERQTLVDELAKMKFNKAKAKVRGLDPKNRLVFYRNSQGVGRWLTRYDLPTLGTRVTLVESHQDEEHKGKLKSEFELSEVVVEPLAGNTN